MPTFWKSDLPHMLPKKNHSVESNEKVRKPIATIGKRKKERIAKHGTESELFARVWAERGGECEECGKVLHEPKAHNFDHVVGKGRDASKRYDPENIRILCFSCHFKKTTGLKYKGPNLD